MNYRHLGDALDHWKGNMFRWLSPPLRDLHVVPMFTDASAAATWSGPTLSCFSQLLGVPESRIVHPQRRFDRSGRGSYFADLHWIDPAADIFFDPDNGIAPHGRGSERHITTAELASFIPPGSDRVLLVYQHSSRVKSYVRSKLEAVAAQPEFDGVTCFGYWAGNVSMIFASRSSARLDALQAAMADVPGETNRVVIHDGPPSPR